MVSNWLITGGCGFLGTSLISKLLDEGQNTRIRVLDNLSVGTTSDLTAVCQYIEKQPSPMAGSPAPNSVVELVVGDIRDYRICLECSQGMDVIVHFAANTGVGPSVEDPRADMEANVIGTFNMLEAARNARVGKFVFASSGAPLGEVEPPIHEEKPAHPV